VTKTPFPDPRDNSKTLYLAYGDFISTMRNKRLPCDPAQWTATKDADEGSNDPKMSSSFTQDLTGGAQGIWLSVKTGTNTYFKRTYYLQSNSFTSPADLALTFTNSMVFGTQTSSGQQLNSQGYVYSHFSWYRDTAHGYAHIQVCLYDLTAKSDQNNLTDRTEDAESDSGHYTRSDDPGSNPTNATTAVTLKANHQYQLKVMLQAYITGKEGGVSGNGGDAEANQLIHLSALGVVPQ
jgi:hypothetical protein